MHRPQRRDSAGDLVGGASARRAGFTLIEMLVVLVILVATTMIAVRSLVNVKDQTGFESTQQTLVNVQDAILGTGPTREGPFVAGFLSDMGRLPVVYAGDGTNNNELKELWELPVGALPSHLEADPVDSQVVLSVGWRGPYVQVPPKVVDPLDPEIAIAPRLLDGFRNPVRIDFSSDPLRWQIESLGADGNVGGTGYDADSSLALFSLDPASVVNRVYAGLSGTVTVASAPAGVTTDFGVRVFVYSPDPATGGLKNFPIDATTADGSGGTTTAIALSSATYPVTFQYLLGPSALVSTSALTSGVRIVRAYAYETGTEARSAPSRSALLTRVLVAGAQVVDFTIP